MSNLYEITGDFLRLLDMMEDPDADQEALTNALEDLQDEFEAKAEGYGKVIRQLEADVEAFKREEEWFRRKRVTLENNVTKLKTALMRAMELTGNQKLDAGAFKFSIAKNGGKRPVLITGDVPEQFLKFKAEADNEKIRQFLDKIDYECEWARYGDAGSHLNIR